MRILAIIALVFLAACGTTYIPTNGLKYGMGRDEAMKTMHAKPVATKAYYNKEFMVYYLHGGFFDYFFVRKAPFVGFYPLVRTGEEFWIILEDGKIVSFGEAKNYKNSVPGALKANIITFEKE